MIRDLCARLGRPSRAWWDCLDSDERAEWLVWWSHQREIEEAARGPKKTAQKQPRSPIPPRKRRSA